MLMTTIARPPSTDITYFFLLCNSIFKKLYFLLFNVESGRFLLPLNSWIFTVITNVRVVVAKRCYWCCYCRRELALFIPANQMGNDILEQVSIFFFLTLVQRHESNCLSKLLSKKNKKMAPPTITAEQCHAACYHCQTVSSQVATMWTVALRACNVCNIASCSFSNAANL